MAHPSSSFSSLVIIPLEPSLFPACSLSLSVAEMRGSVSPRFLWLRCKCPLTELRLHVALPLLPCIPVPIFKGLCKGLVPFYCMGLEPERGLRCQRKGCGAVTHMALSHTSVNILRYKHNIICVKVALIAYQPMSAEIIS